MGRISGPLFLFIQVEAETTGLNSYETISEETGKVTIEETVGFFSSEF